MTITDYHWLHLLIIAILLPSCATIPGSADSLPSSRPVPLSRAEWAKIRKAQIKCLDKIKDLRGDCQERIERIEVGHRAALRVQAIDLHQCRQERDRAMGRRCVCPKARGVSIVVPIVVGVIAGVVGVGVGVVIGVVVGD